MGKAVITSEAGDGLYTIDVVFDTAAAEALKAKLEGSLAIVETSLVEETDETALAFLGLRKVAIIKQIERVNAASNMSRTASAWCADLTEGLTGEVGTIEIGTEAEKGVNIQPGHEAGQIYDAVRDGIETPFLTMGVADAMRNFAIMPGIQKWRPTYRYATISNIDTGENTCTVTLEPLQSSIQGLDINPVSVITDVPIEYMDCDSAVFTAGDAVLVKFDPYDADGQAKVIGFKSDPKSCSLSLKLNSINGIAFPTGSNSYQLRITQPIPQEITHYKKGTYTEDFTVIGSGQCDNAGVTDITIDPGMSIDQDFSINVQVANYIKWGYYTTDWKGSVPDRGVNFPGGGSEPYPVGDLSRFDYVVDHVAWVFVDIDLRVENKTSFQDADGATKNGYLINPTGIKVLKQDYRKWNYTDLECTWGVLPESFSYPINELHEEERLKKTVVLNRSPNGTYIGSYVYQPPYSYGTILYCNQDPGLTCDCYGTESDKTIKYVQADINPYDPGYTVPWEADIGSPAIFSDRKGVFVSYIPSERIVDATWPMRQKYMWAEYVVGTGGHWCDPGQDTNGCGDAFGLVWEAGQHLTWSMIDIDEEYL